MISTPPEAEAHAAPPSADDAPGSGPLSSEPPPALPGQTDRVVRAADDGLGERATDPPATRPDSPSARHAVANLDTGSVAPVSRDTPDLDFGNDDEGFFTKSLDEVHAEELRRSAPDLHEDHVRVALARRPRIDHRRARSIVVGVLGVCALIGATAMVRRTISTPHRGSITESAIAQAAAAPVATVSAPQLELPTMPAPVAEPVAQAPTEAADPSVAAAPVVAEAQPPTAATEAPAATVAPTAAPAAAPTTAALAAAPAPVDDPDAALSGAQLLAAARSAISGNNAPRAAALARKAIAKGAGGSAQYVLGAAYQAMGANAGAKSAYGSCAKSGAAEAGECAALVDSL